MTRTPAAERVAISRAELAQRQDVLRSAARKQGWPGLAIVGRGGGTYDRHGELLWASGHYQAYPFLRDRPPLWSGRAHSLLTLPVDGPSTLLVSAPEYDEAAVCVDRIIVADGAFAQVARELLEPLESGGLAGADCIPAPLAGALPLDRMFSADDLIESLRRQKSIGEQAVLRAACAVGTDAVTTLMEAAHPGATEGDAVSAALAVAARAGAVPYLVALAAGEQARAFTGRPLPGFRPERAFVAGELARLDLVLVLEGYYCDFGRTWIVGGDREGSAGARELLGVLRDAIAAAVRAAIPGAPAGAVAGAGQASLPDGYTTAYPPHWGHGLGVSWEGPWLLADEPEVLQAGCALAIETAISGQGLIAAAEDDVLMGSPDGAEVLTPAPWSTT